MVGIAGWALLSVGVVRGWGVVIRGWALSSVGGRCRPWVGAVVRGRVVVARDGGVVVRGWGIVVRGGGSSFADGGLSFVVGCCRSWVGWPFVGGCRRPWSSVCGGGRRPCVGRGRP